MIRRFNRNIFLKAAELSGFYHLARKRKKGATVLFYHGVEKYITYKEIQGLHLHINLFEKQIKYLHKEFEIISLDYLYDCLINGYELNSSQVVLTFDDGYKNNLTVVEPILKSYNMPFSIFISTNHIDKGSRVPTYYMKASIFYTDNKILEIKSINRKFDISTQQKRIAVKNVLMNILKTAPCNQVTAIVDELISLMPDSRWQEIDSILSSEELLNWSDVKKLHDQGIIIGSHCHDHTILHANQNDADITYQLKTSKDLIVKYLGECKYFSYPNGGMKDICNNAVKKVKDNNYLLGFTTVLGELKNYSNSYMLPRIGGEKDINIFKLDLNTTVRYKELYSKWCLNY